MSIDIYRGTTGVALPKAVSEEIWGKTLGESAFMQLARKVNIPGNGMKVQVITGEPEANWVNETDPKPVSAHTFTAKDVIPYKLAVIEPFSEEFRRDAAALYAECVQRAPKALAKKFDETIKGTTAPGAGFDVLGGATAVSLTPAAGATVYDQFVAVDGAISAANGVMNGIGLAPQGRSIVFGAKDNNGNPQFTTVDSGAISPILGAPVKLSEGLYAAGTPNTVGIAGDFTNAIWGSVEDIKMAISDQATITIDGNPVNLWERNMFAVRWEIEVAFAVQDIAQYVLLTD